MFSLKHCMPPHWEYNIQNAPSYEKWGTNFVCKKRHGLHALDFVANFVNFEKDVTMVSITCRTLYLDPNDGHCNFFVKLQKDIRIGCKSNSILKHIQTASGSIRKGRLFVQMFLILKSCLRVCKNHLK